MRWSKPCCPELEKRYQNEYGAWLEKGTVGNQVVKNEKHADMMIMQKTYREAVQNGDIDSILSLKFTGDV